MRKRIRTEFAGTLSVTREALQLTSYQTEQLSLLEATSAPGAPLA